MHHKRMRLVFLDMDGVLNGYVDQIKGVEVDPDKVILLNNAAKESGFLIVLSSAWRNYYSIHFMQNLLNICGLKSSYIIDYTPVVPGKRGDEIDAFFNRTRGHYEIENYVIIDDNADFYPHHQPHFVHTDGKVGLTEDDAARICQILKDKSLFLR